MKSLEKKFNIIRKKYKYSSSFICFIETIQKGNYKKLTVHRWFNKIIDKNDYDLTDRKEIINWIDKIIFNKKDKI